MGWALFGKECASVHHNDRKSTWIYNLKKIRMDFDQPRRKEVVDDF